MTDDAATSLLYLFNAGFPDALVVVKCCLMFAGALQLLIVLMAPPGVGAGDDL